MSNLKNNMGQSIGTIFGIIISYFFSSYLLADVKPTGGIYKFGFAIIIYILIQGSACIGEKYLNKKK